MIKVITLSEGVTLRHFQDSRFKQGCLSFQLVRQMAESDVAVVELSSFQLMDMTRSPRVAVITNLSPNHLDVHRDYEEYISARSHGFPQPAHIRHPDYACSDDRQSY